MVEKISNEKRYLKMPGTLKLAEEGNIVGLVSLVMQEFMEWLGLRS